MNILKNLFIFNKKVENEKGFNQASFDCYGEIAKLVKESRTQQNLTIQELSFISKIPETIIISIENNNENTRPKYPFIRSILIKLEECLALKRNTLVELSIRKRESCKKNKEDFVVRNFDILNTWQGTLLYFFILVLTIFIIKRYFALNVNVIEIQNIENKIIDK
tara:strand:+ start:552 stop:1046 length:495 start_codon:yes stop_codon:yes gene_type:complete